MQRQATGFVTLVAAAIALWCAPTPADAVLITEGDGSGNTTATGSFGDAFDHVGSYGVGSVIYLGYGAVLTANHVAGTPSGTIDLGGDLYDIVEGSKVRLKVPSSSTAVDLALFQISGYTGLEPLTVGSVGFFDEVYMVGDGRDRHEDESYWSGSWQPTLPRNAVYSGYETYSSRTMRWGRNYVQGLDGVFENTDMAWTQFDENQLSDEAQAVAHDSGGAVFHEEAGVWELVGVMLAASTYTDQPDNTAVFGNRTYFAELSVYEDQIDDYIADIIASWVYGDANHDGVVGANDLLAIELNWGLTGVADGTMPGDADFNGLVNDDDLLAVRVNFGADSPSAAPDVIGATPEPTAALLLGAGLPLLLRRRTR